MPLLPLKMKSSLHLLQMALASHLVTPSEQFLFDFLAMAQPQEEPQSDPRLFNSSHVIPGHEPTFLAVNSTALGNAAGLVLAGSFLSAAVIANLPENLSLQSIRKSWSKGTTNQRSDGVKNEKDGDEKGKSCNCEDTCYDEYLRGYQDSYDAHFGTEATAADTASAAASAYRKKRE